MHKSFIATLAATAALALTATGAGAQSLPTKIGYVNTGRIEQEMPGVAEGQALLNKEFAPYQQEIEKMRDSLTALNTAYERDLPRLDSATRTQRQKAFQLTDSIFGARAAALNTTMQTRQSDVFGPLLQRVQTVIEEIRNEQGYAVIFSTGGQTNAILTADKRLDLTDAVIARLKAAPGPVTSPAGVVRPKK